MLKYKTCKILKDLGFRHHLDDGIVETFAEIFGLQTVYPIDEVISWLKERDIIIDPNSKTLDEDIIHQLEEKELC